MINFSVADQLWLLKQVYEYDNSYFDDKKKIRLYRIPEKISAESLSALEKMGHMPNQIYMPKHDEIIGEFCRLTDTWTLKEASDAFVAGLWSQPFIWQSALTAKVMAMGLPPHVHTPYGNSKGTCAVCGYRDKAIDITEKWYFLMCQGTPLDGDPIGHVIALKEMEKMGKRPTPTKYDWWTFRAILTVIRSKRDERPNVRVEVQAPLAWWDSSVGINETALKKIFPEMDCSSVDLTDRPVPIPPLGETVTGQFEKKRRSKADISQIM